MCGRYFLGEEEQAEELRGIIAEANRRTDAALKTSGEVFPTDAVPVLANSRAMRPAGFPMTWGYTLSSGGRVINARSETAAEKPMFRDGMAQRRCLVPAVGYFEWEKRGGARVKYALAPVGMTLFYMAGIYRAEGDQTVFTILTREAAPEIAFLHERMPVILAGRDWLDTRYAARDILRDAVTDVAYRAAD